MKCVLELFFPIGIDNCNFFEKIRILNPVLLFAQIQKGVCCTRSGNS